jgi:hypothetical protein
MEAPLDCVDSCLQRIHVRKRTTENILKHNSARTLASMGADIKSLPGSGPYCFRIHYLTYDIVSLLYPNEANKPGYGQMYIFEVAEEKKIEKE